MHKTYVGLIVALAAATLVGCSSGMDVNATYMEGSDFSGFNTYDWVGPQQPTGDPRVDNPVLDQRIRSAVDDGLAAIGLRKVTTSPDLGVRYVAMVRDTTDTYTLNSAGGGAFRQQTYSNTFEVGTLVLDLLDSETNEMVWRASAEAELQATDSPADRDKRVAEAVTKMLDKFPR